MMKQQSGWFYSPSKVSKVKLAVTNKTTELIDNTLKPEYITPPAAALYYLLDRKTV